jgi:hypothetical protein
MILAMNILDAFSHPFHVMIRISVLMTPVYLVLDASIHQFDVMTTVLVLMMAVILPPVVLLHKSPVTIMTFVLMITVILTLDVSTLLLIAMIRMPVPKMFAMLI